MNVYRLIGDGAHVCAIVLLLAKILWSRSCAGISGRAQVLYSIVFLARYADLFTNFISIYNSTLKVSFIAASLGTVYLIYLRFKDTYDSRNDTFRIGYLLVPASVLAVYLNHEQTVVEVMWTFSIYLETVAILPQLAMTIKTGETEFVAFPYLFLMGSYRALYIGNWVYRYYFEGFYDIVASVAGVLQTIPYIVFYLVLCFTKMSRKKEVDEGFVVKI